VLASAGTTPIASSNETYAAANRYLLIVAVDPFDSTIISYTYANNAYPPAGTEWIVMANGIPDYISNVDYYVLGTGQMIQNSSPAVANASPSTAYLAAITSSPGQFTIVATPTGSKSILATSQALVLTGGASIVADLSNGVGKQGYTFLVAAEQLPAGVKRTNALVRPQSSGRGYPVGIRRSR
jgi:hypothetical protein